MRLLRALPIAAAALIFALPAGASADVLWDQFDTSSSDYESVIFPPPFDQGNQEVADDFLVNAPGWTVSEVDVHGRNVGGQASFVRVAFYANNGTLPADDPITAEPQLTPSVGLDTGNFSVPLDPPVVLPPGTYWVSVQAVRSGGDWDWTARATQNLHEAALRAGGGHGYNCPNWISLDNCFHTTEPDPDTSFRLIGSVAGGSGPPPPVSPPPKDTTPPVLTSTAPKTESVKSGFVTVTDTTNEPATDTATGTVSVPGAAKTYRLRSASAKHGAGKVKLKLRIPKNALKAIRHRHKGTAKVKVVSRDDAGNSTTRSLRIKLKP
jgi:hypothetical protein